MHCISCERAIAAAIKGVPGVLDATVSFATGRATVTGDAEIGDLVSAVHHAGYEASPLEEKRKSRDKDFIPVLLSILCTIPLLIQMAVDYLPPWVQFILATIVQFGFGYQFYIGSFYSIRSRVANMDLLICLGTSAAYFYSTALLFLGKTDHLYFESSATIITLILLGRWIEMRSRKRAAKAVEALLSLQPKTALIKKGEAWVEAPIGEIKAGDLFQVRPGERVPLDGYVIDGSSYIDESMMTGEPLPLHKNSGDKVFAGTQNQNGFITAKAEAVGAATALAGIIRQVQEAEHSRAPVQKLADKISAIFVPTVVVISIVTFVLWYFFRGLTPAITNAVSVLIVACPCALGLATPMVIMVAVGRFAKAGIYVKNAEAIERAGKITTLVLDKTGTITEGKPTIVERTVDARTLEIAASLEVRSDHPLAKIIAEQSPGFLKIENFTNVPGKGVMGEFQGKRYYVGSLDWMREMALQGEIKASHGKTIVAIADEERVLGHFAFSDPLKKDAPEFVAWLKANKIKPLLVTGDQEGAAKMIANEVSIDEVYARLLPEQKGALVAKMKSATSVVGMVGDGINDAPALAQADVSFAMRTGSDIAIQSADLTIMKSDLMSVKNAIQLSKKSFEKIKQNLFFAFIYNIFGIPLAALGVFNPMLAALLMSLSSLSVVLNSIRRNH